MKSAVRLNDHDIDANTISTEFRHLDHMYSGRFSEYYYRRFDQALAAAQPEYDEIVCEIGGGTGVFLLSLAQHYSSVHFSDVSRESPLFSTPRELTELVEITSSSIHYTVTDATNLSYCSNIFDSVFVLDVLEHVPDERSAISEIARVTSNSGKAIISAPIEVGIPVLAREGYRMVDGDRRHTKSISELWSAFTGCPVLEQNKEHRSYDYRQTIQWLRQDFNQISVEYCPWPRLGSQANPTAIISATF